ncbi:DNA-binding response regulator [Taibaiella sp. KBW10]|uniref:response regulator transcription factor n=1 Tax=Taibaiella sp. KBW10 TaxID=2153357 RepID=UPI000F5A9891|nr:response regulator transcription factor [Taibaiella sp. KBW10]RQO30446.1 DNA-binding response regulator [Taibaiella sp. KBW10]
MSFKAKILLVEDDASLGFVVKDNLEDNGYEVLLCSDGESGWQTFMRQNIDICLLDVMLPKKDGMALASLIRQKNNKIPILFLTAKNMDEDKIAGFKAGGDDYIVKPFNMEELLLRIEVFLKRSKDDKVLDEKIELGNNSSFDYDNLQLVNQGHPQQLTQKEADLFKYLIQNKNMVLKREDILMNVWGKDDYFLGRSMDVFMTKVRKYIKGIEGVELQTMHGVGFKLVFDK